MIRLAALCSDCGVLASVIELQLLGDLNAAKNGQELK